MTGADQATREGQDGGEITVRKIPDGKSWGIWLGDDIVIVITDIDHSHVRLGVEAPREIPVYRSELLPLKDDGRQPDRQGA